jgi:hypothetical protein
MLKIIFAIAIEGFALHMMLGTVYQTRSQDAMTPYPKMAPVDQYLMADRAAEIAMARSAAPAYIARDADVMVLGPHGFETAVKGKNGFVCIVGRGWTSAADADFWNPKVRIRRRQRTTLAFPPHVLLFGHRPGNLGSESAGFGRHCGC